ncbi:MAG TPA: bacillithiol system redox-active protein YtxJ [Balneola sp.]|jgi:bacillithiol system protein YtxJ|nr:bacillithiol system redox-active protein YtxJ [Bacteroidota bacterium]HCI71348.1 bacillithiol system redox-active protein YtxJ [Balneola sp.]HCT55429.1 bacillithiol system redox-active protein YtxJ [Balneola sp.]|tara:strand:+ start:100 stop:495 length:396 start_codon:yes stop_codon:yes gene_type:complete
MGFLEKITNALSGDGNSSEEETIWNSINSEDQIDKILKLSHERIQIVYKHSPSCGVSYFALRNLNNPELLENSGIDFYLIDVIRQRPISRSFAEKVNVRHESPQIFVIKNEKVIWHDSHNSVTAKNVLRHI